MNNLSVKNKIYSTSIENLVIYIKGIFSFNGVESKNILVFNLNQSLQKANDVHIPISITL